MTQPQLSVRDRAREMFDMKLRNIFHNFQKEYNQLDIKFNEPNPLERKAIKTKYVEEVNEIIDQIITLAQEEKIKEVEKLVIVPESTPHLSPYISGVNETIRKVVIILKQ